MRRFSLVLLLSLAAVCVRPLLAGPPVATNLELEPEVPATLSLTPVAERWDGRGFMPLRVRIENRGRERLSWELFLTAGIGYGGSTLEQVAPIAAEGGEIVETVVYVPGAAVLQGGQRCTVSVRLSGPGAERAGAYMLGGNSESVLPTATVPALEGALFSATHGAPGERTEITTIEPARWPADWRVWSPFRRVVLTEREFSLLDGARRAALRDWVAMGGVLDLYPDQGRGEKRVDPHGHGVIRRNERTLADEAADTVKPLIMLPSPGIDDLRRARLVEVSSERRVSLEPEGGRLGVALFLLGFGVVIGPLNLFVFAPSGRRHRLFFTVPAIALGASALLAVYIVMKDGFGGEGARIGTVVLLPAENQAVVTQIQLSRTGVLTGTEFELPDDVVMERNGGQGQSWDPHFANSARSDRYERSLGRAGGDWFASRRVQEHTLRRLSPTRARVELVAGGEGGAAPVVQSSVGTILRDFRYTDTHGRGWGVAELAPGQRATLARVPSAAGERRGMFTARGGAAEGLAPIPTLGSIRWDEPQFLYLGSLVETRAP